MTQTTKWISVHLMPLLCVAIATNGLNPVIGETPAAGIALLLIIASVAIGQSRLISTAARSRWMWQTAAAIGFAIGVAIFLISTIDLAGYDTAATLVGMTAGGLTLGLIQSQMLPEGKLKWIAASAGGWLLAAIIFRQIIAPMAAFNVGGIAPWGLAYNEGHNELLWSSTGLAFYGLTTALLLAKRSAGFLEASS